MTGFEPRISGVGSDRSTNSATTTAQLFTLVYYFWEMFLVIQTPQNMT